MVQKAELHITPPPALEDKATPTGALTTSEKTFSVQTTANVPPSTKSAGWTWSQIAKYSAYAAGASFVVYHSHAQLWDLAQKTFSVLKTAVTVITKGIPVVVDAAQTGVDATDKLYNGLGQAVVVARTGLRSMNVPGVPANPTTREGVVSLGANAVGIGLVGAGTAAANIIPLAPLVAGSTLLFGKPGKMTGLAALGAIIGEAARPGTVQDIGDQAEVIGEGMQKACEAWPEGCTVAMNTVGAVGAGLAVKAAHGLLGGTTLVAAGAAAAAGAAEAINPGTFESAAKAGKTFTEMARPHVRKAIALAKNKTDEMRVAKTNVQSGLVKAYETWPFGFNMLGLTGALAVTVSIAVSALSCVGNAAKSAGKWIMSHKTITAVFVTGGALPVAEFFVPGSVETIAQKGKGIQDAATTHWNRLPQVPTPTHEDIISVGRFFFS